MGRRRRTKLQWKAGEIQDSHIIASEVTWERLPIVLLVARRGSGEGRHHTPTHPLHMKVRTYIVVIPRRSSQTRCCSSTQSYLLVASCSSTQLEVCLCQKLCSWTVTNSARYRGSYQLYLEYLKLSVREVPCYTDYKGSENVEVVTQAGRCTLSCYLAKELDVG